MLFPVTNVDRDEKVEKGRKLCVSKKFISLFLIMLIVSVEGERRMSSSFVLIQTSYNLFHYILFYL